MADSTAIEWADATLNYVNGFPIAQSLRNMEHFKHG